MRRVGLVGMVAALVWSLALPALGQVEVAPQPFDVSVDAQVELGTDLPGPRIQRAITGSSLELGEVTGTYSIIDLVGPCGNNGRIVTSLVICPVHLELRAEVAPESPLEIQCSLRGIGAVVDDLSLTGRCVVKAAEQGVHGTGEVEGSFDAESGAMSLTITGMATCRSLNPKDCLSG